MEEINIGILTISDRCSKGEMKDESGPNLKQLIENGIIKNGKVLETDIVPDDKLKIQEVLIKWCDEKKINLIFTTGGTGLSPRDVTPEATKPLLEKIIPGISSLMLEYSLSKTPNAPLSRYVSGIRKKTLIINFPGSTKGAQECLESVASIIPHAIDEICNRKSENFHSHSKIEYHSKAKMPVEKKIAYTYVEVEKAQKLILERSYALKRITCMPLSEALGCVLAEEAIATDSHPSCDVSLKDGYAVSSSDDSSKRKIIGTCNVGTLNSNIKVVNGVCAKISTGAPLPSGADAVIPIELTKNIQPGEITINFSKYSASSCPTDQHFGFGGPSSGNRNKQSDTFGTNSTYTSFPTHKQQFGSVNSGPTVLKGNEVRCKGSDFEMGTLLLDYGTYLDSSALGLLASAGISSVRIFAKPKVAVFSTGDELINFGDKLTEGKVRDCNRLILLSLLKEEGFSGSDLGIVNDEPDALLTSLHTAFKTADIVVTSGSMSMGDRDYMKEVIAVDFNAEILFEKICMMPGKPTACAIMEYEGKKKLWFGLPGNPASVFVTSQLLLLPTLKKISAFKKILPSSVSATLTFDIEQTDRPQYHRAILSIEEGKYVATTTGNQRSSRIGSCVNSNCLLVIPAGCKVGTGSSVKALLIGKNHEIPNNGPTMKPFTFTSTDTIKKKNSTNSN